MTTQPMLRTGKAAALVDKKVGKGKLSEFESTLLEKELASLEKADPGQAKSLRALSLAAEGRFQESFAMHECVVANEPEESVFLGNYATSLSAAGRFKEAAEKLYAAWEVDKTSVQFLYEGIKAAVASGDEEIIAKLGEKICLVTGKSMADFEVESGMMFAEIPTDQFYRAACLSGSFQDWARLEEEEAWKNLS